MQNFVRRVDQLGTALAVLASIMLASAMLIVCWMVLWRAMGNSTYWEIELATYLIVAAVLLGSPYCLRTKGHVGVDLLSEMLPHRWHRRLGQVLAILGIVVLLYLAWKGALLTYDSFEGGETSGSSWDPPRWPLFITMPIGLGLTALQYVAEMLRADEAPTNNKDVPA